MNGDTMRSPGARAPEITGEEEEANAYSALVRKEEEELAKMKEAAATSQVVSALSKLGIEEAKDNHVFNENKFPASPKRPSFLLKSPSEYLPMIRRGFTRGEEKEQEQVISVGWKIEVRNRKEREEMLRDEVDRFEIKLKRFANMLEEGIDVTMWQLHRSVELSGEETDEFGLVSTPVTIKLHRRGKLFVQAVLAFSLRGGYLSKAIGRHRGELMLGKLRCPMRLLGLFSLILLFRS
jgi:hypothetical protein